MGIENIVYIRTTNGYLEFPYQTYVDFLIENGLLHIENTIILKNKELVVTKIIK